MNFERINIAEAKSLLDEPDVRIADIRDAHSFNDNHIKGAVNVDNDNLPEFMQNTPKDAPLIVCCYPVNIPGTHSRRGRLFF